MDIRLTEWYTTFHATGRLNFQRFADIREIEHFVPILLPFGSIAINSRFPFVFDESSAKSQIEFKNKVKRQDGKFVFYFVLSKILSNFFLSNAKSWIASSMSLTLGSCEP